MDHRDSPNCLRQFADDHGVYLCSVADAHGVFSHGTRASNISMKGSAGSTLRSLEPIPRALSRRGKGANELCLVGIIAMYRNIHANR